MWGLRGWDEGRMGSCILFIPMCVSARTCAFLSLCKKSSYYKTAADRRQTLEVIFAPFCVFVCVCVYVCVSRATVYWLEAHKVWCHGPIKMIHCSPVTFVRLKEKALALSCATPPAIRAYFMENKIISTHAKPNVCSHLKHPGARCMLWVCVCICVCMCLWYFISVGQIVLYIK